MNFFKRLINFFYPEKEPVPPVLPAFTLPEDVEKSAVVHYNGRKISVYKDAKGEWRWKIQSSNNRTIAASSESYKNRKDAVKNLNSILTINLTIN
jgi:uncharacterized protein YegP (UPF0339 family)